MGQGQSRPPAFHPSTVSSERIADLEASRHYPTSASGWIKRPRSRFIAGRRDRVSSTDIISYPHHQFIPKEQRQRSAGPIRSRPEPCEYAPRPAPQPPWLPSSLALSPTTTFPPTNVVDSIAGASTTPNPLQPSAETSPVESLKRSSAHRVSARPRDPPLLEEPESIKDHASVDGHCNPPQTPPSASDHGHEPVPISPSLALALKAGLGSCSLPRTQDDHLAVDAHNNASITSARSNQGGPDQPSSRLQQGAELWTRTPRPSIPEGCQSELEDFRQSPSDQASPQPSAIAASSRAQNSRFSFSSSHPTTSSSGNQSDAHSGRCRSSIYATRMDLQRYSCTASETGDSAQNRASISVFRHPLPHSSRSQCYTRASSSSIEANLAVPATWTPAASIARSKRHSGTQQPAHQRSNPSLFSASSDCDPAFYRDQHADQIATASNQTLVRQNAINPATLVHRAFDSYEEPAQDTAAASRRSSILRSIHSDVAGSRQSLLGTKQVEQLRRGPQVELHQDSIDTIFDVQPNPVVRRTRALTLIDRLRGKSARAAQASTAEANMVTVQAQLRANPANAGSMRSRLRSLSHAQAANRSVAQNAPTQTLSIQSQSHAQSQTQQLSWPSASGTLGQRPPQHGSSPIPAQTGATTSSVVSDRIAPQAAFDSSRPTSIRSVRTQRSVRSARSYNSSNGSLSARYKAAQPSQPSSNGFSSSRAKSTTTSTSSLWWKQNQLKRKGFEGIVSEAQAAKQGRSGFLPSGHEPQDSAWVDIDAEEQQTTASEDPSTFSKALSSDNPFEAKPQKSKMAGGLWIWPRRPSAARVFSFRLSRSQSGHGGRAERVGSEPCYPTTARSTQPDDAVLSPVNVIGMPVDTSSSSLRPVLAGSSTGNSSETSFTSLAPPIPPAPVPPLRKPRRPLQKTQTPNRQERSDSVDSILTLSCWVDGAGDSNIQPPQQTQQHMAQSEASLAQTEITATQAHTSSTSATSLAVRSASTAPTSVNAATSAGEQQSSLPPTPRVTAPKHKAVTLSDYALSPAPTLSRRLSDISDAGTKETLLLDRESLTAPKMSSDSFVRGPIEEQHPHLQTFYPAGIFVTRPVRPTPSTITSPLSPMTEEEAGTASPRRVGGLPDFSSPSLSLGHDGSLGRSTSAHTQDPSLTETSRSFRSVPSFRSTSDGSVRRYRPLPTLPGRAPGNSVDSTMNRRNPSYGTDSFLTAESHRRYGSIEQPAPDRIDGLPVRDTQLSPLMLMGMVTAANSPTQSTHNSHDGLPEEPSRSSLASIASPMAGTRPLPSIPTRSIDATLDLTRPHSKGAGQRRSLSQAGGAAEGPPLSPSAFYDIKPQTLLPPAKTPAGPRHSWSSADGPWSAAVVTASSVVGAVRGIASPERTVTDGDVLRRALAQPRDDRDDAYRNSERQMVSSGVVIDDDEDAELTRLEMWRSGSKILPKQTVRSESADGSVIVDRAPFADTGVQASLAALRALESPGESLRTVLARQRIFGEPDASVAECLRESHILDSESPLDDQDLLVMSGPRPRRRAAPYPRLRESFYSSEEFSSSGRSLSGRRVDRIRRRRQQNYTSMAEASSASVAETSGRGSDSEGATLAAIRYVRSRTARGSAEGRASQTHGGRRDSAVQTDDVVAEETPSASRATAWEDLAGITKPEQGWRAASSRLDSDNAVASQQGKIPEMALTPPVGNLEQQQHASRPRHDRYVTAMSHADSTMASHEQDIRELADQTQDPIFRPVDFDGGVGLSPHANAVSPASTISPALLLKHERVASQMPSSATLVGSRVAFPISSIPSGSLHEQRYMQSPSLPHDLAIAQRSEPRSYVPPATRIRPEKDTEQTSRRMLVQQRQRSQSDVHVSSAQNSRISLPRSRHYETEMSRYDAQLEDLLHLREKVLQLESSRGHGRFDSLATSFVDHGGTISNHGDHSYSVDRSDVQPRKSSTSSKRKLRPSKLGYTMPDIMAWQAGLGNNNQTSSAVV